MSSVVNGHPGEENSIGEKDVGQNYCPSELPTWHIVKRECNVLDCNNNSSKSVMFPFPECEFNETSLLDRCKIWLQACGNEILLDLNLSDIHEHAFICSLHFDDNQFTDNSRSELVSTAVPTLFLPASIASEKVDEYLARFTSGHEAVIENDGNHFIDVGDGDTKVPIQQAGDVEYACPSCTKRFPLEGCLDMHWKLVHADEGPLECTLCDKIFMRGCDYRKHFRIHTTKMPYVCIECEKCFISKFAYTKHQNSSHSEGNPFCTLCSRRFSSVGSLKLHLKTHSGEKQFACGLCDRRFFMKSSLKAHRRTHASKSCQCSVCGDIFPDQPTLRCHFIRHEEEKPFGCNKCARRFPEQKYLIIHLKTHNGKASFRCEDCKRRYPTEESLQLHRKSHRENERVLCSHCKTPFYSLSRLVQHYCSSTRAKRNICPICFVEFSSKYVLNEHLHVHNLAKEPCRPYACTLCCKRFMTNTSLHSHMYAQHNIGYDFGPSREAPSKPKKNTKVARRKLRKIREANRERLSRTVTRILRGENAVTTREKAQSTGYVAKEPGRPYACTECYKRFMTNTSLHSHMYAQHNIGYDFGPSREASSKPKKNTKVARRKLCKIREANRERSNPTVTTILDGENAVTTLEEKAQSTGYESPNDSVTFDNDMKFFLKQEIDEELTFDSHGENEGMC